MILQKSFLYADLVLNNNFLLSMLKMVLLLNIFVETVIYTTIEKFGESKIICMEINTYIQQ